MRLYVHFWIGLAASTSTRASHRWIRRAIREPTYPAARPGGSAAFSQSAAPPPQAAVFSKQLPMLSGSQHPLTPRAPTPLDAVICTRLNQRSMDDQRQRDAERGHAQRHCRFEARAVVSRRFCGAAPLLLPDRYSHETASACCSVVLRRLRRPRRPTRGRQARSLVDRLRMMLNALLGLRGRVHQQRSWWSGREPLTRVLRGCWPRQVGMTLRAWARCMHG